MARTYRDLVDAALSLDFTRPGSDQVFWTTPESDENLAASAAPLTPEQELRAAVIAAEKARLLEGVPAEFQSRLPGETMDEYGARYGASIRAGFDASDAEYAARKRAGYKHPDRVQMEAEWLADNPEPMSATFVRQDEGSAYSPLTNFQPGSTVTVDGVQVPAADLGDGQLRYRLGDVKRAQEAEQEAKWLAGHRQMVADDMAKYGHYSVPDESDVLTPAQYQARLDRKRAEDAVQSTPRAQELRRQRLAARAGVPEEVDDGMSEEQRLRAMARNQQSAQRASARDMITRRAQARQNPLEYINRDDVDDLSKAVVAQSMLAASGGRGPFDVQIAEAAAGGDTARIGVMHREVDARIEAMRQEAEQARADRQMQAQQFDARMEEMRADRERRSQEVAARMASEAQARQEQNQMLLAKMAQDAKEAEQRFGLGSQEAEARLAALMAQIEQARADSAMRSQQHTEAMDLKRDELGMARQQVEDNKALMERERLLGSLASQYGEGARNLAEADYESPVAQEALRKIALDSDKSFYGFWLDDAARMDAVLKRLGITDAAARQQLVETYGMEPSEDFLGSGGRGRGERGSYWFSGRPW